MDQKIVELYDDFTHRHFDRRLLSQALTNIVKNATEGIEAYAGDSSFAIPRW